MGYFPRALEDSRRECDVVLFFQILRLSYFRVCASAINIFLLFHFNFGKVLSAKGYLESKGLAQEVSEGNMVSSRGYSCDILV